MDLNYGIKKEIDCFIKYLILNTDKKKIYAFICCSDFVLDKTNKSLIGADSIISGDNYGNLFLIFGSKSNWKSTKIFSVTNKDSILSIGTNKESDKFGITLDYIFGVRIY